MSDDLVKQLRFTADDVCRCGTPVCLEAADRIEKLNEDVGVLIAASIRLSSRIDLDSDHYVDRIEKLEAALRGVLIGGNHVALLIGVGHPPHTATHEKALTHYGAGDAYDAWCCWKTIMEARKALEGKDD